VFLLSEEIPPIFWSHKG